MISNTVLQFITFFLISSSQQSNLKFNRLTKLDEKMCISVAVLISNNLNQMSWNTQELKNEIVRVLPTIFLPYKVRLAVTNVRMVHESEVSSTNVVRTKLHHPRVKQFAKIQSIREDIVIYLVTDSSMNEEPEFSSICKNTSVAIVLVNQNDDFGFLVFNSARKIAKLLGLTETDQKLCPCPNDKGCLMHRTISYFSAEKDKKIIKNVDYSTIFMLDKCSIEQLNTVMQDPYKFCLYDCVGKSHTPICGNGIKDDNEDCDCGTKQMCELAGEDICCNHETCKFKKSHYQCSSGSCCSGCMFSSPHRLCRLPKTECDLPDYCDGKSFTCHQNIRQNGASCESVQGYCHNGACTTLDQRCQDIYKDPNAHFSGDCYSLHLQASLNCQDSKHSSSASSICGDYGIGECGYLYCSGLSEESKTRAMLITFNIKEEGHEEANMKFECYVHHLSLQLNPIALIPDGIKCGDGKICDNQKCTFINETSDKPSCFDSDCARKMVCSNDQKCVRGDSEIIEASLTAVADSRWKRLLYANLISGFLAIIIGLWCGYRGTKKISKK